LVERLTIDIVDSASNELTHNLWAKDGIVDAEIETFALRYAALVRVGVKRVSLSGMVKMMNVSPAQPGSHYNRRLYLTWESGDLDINSPTHTYKFALTDPTDELLDHLLRGGSSGSTSWDSFLIDAVPLLRDAGGGLLRRVVRATFNARPRNPGARFP
jgi:hypothetical protein